jgi:uncharacterized protein YeaO (DUF488 family)
MIVAKRIYESKYETEGIRILVDRIWPRGITKESANLHDWMRNIAPSVGLRKWYNHEPDKFEEFRSKYLEELRMHQDEISRLVNIAVDNKLILLYSSKDKRHNQAVVLKDYLDSLRIKNKPY